MGITLLGLKIDLDTDVKVVKHANYVVFNIRQGDSVTHILLKGVMMRSVK
jgi:hypothetical protein